MNEDLHPYQAVLLQSIQTVYRASTLIKPVFADEEEAALALLRFDEIVERISPPRDDVSSETGEQLMSLPAWDGLLGACLRFVSTWESGFRAAPPVTATQEVLQELATVRQALEAAIADVRQKGGWEERA